MGIPHDPEGFNWARTSREKIDPKVGVFPGQSIFDHSTFVQCIFWFHDSLLHYITLQTQEQGDHTGQLARKISGAASVVVRVRLRRRFERRETVGLVGVSPSVPSSFP